VAARCFGVLSAFNSQKWRRVGELFAEGRLQVVAKAALQALVRRASRYSIIVEQEPVRIDINERNTPLSAASIKSGTKHVVPGEP